MKVCVVGPSTRFLSGLSVATMFLANAFADNGDSVSVILIDKIVPEFLYPARSNVGRDDVTVSFRDSIRVHKGMNWNSLVSWVKAVKFLQREKPDAIVMLWWSSAVAHMQLFLAMVNKVSPKSKLILDMHEIVDPLEEKLLPVRWYSRVVGRALTQWADAFAAHSSEARRLLVSAYRMPKERVSVIPMGLPEDYGERFDKALSKSYIGLDKDKFLILYFGSVREYKGVKYLIRAFNSLPDDIAKNSNLLISGECWEGREELENQREVSKYPDNIILGFNWVSDNLIPRYFSAADVVVLPYLRTMGSAVLNIAMAHGKPIIVSDLGVLE